MFCARSISKKIDGITVNDSELHELLNEVDVSYSGRLELWDYFQVMKQNVASVGCGCRPHKQTHTFQTNSEQWRKGLLNMIFWCRFFFIIRNNSNLMFRLIEYLEQSSFITHFAVSFFLSTSINSQASASSSFSSFQSLA